MFNLLNQSSVKTPGFAVLSRSVSQSTVRRMSQYTEDYIKNKLTQELEASHVVSPDFYYFLLICQNTPNLTILSNRLPHLS